MIQNVFRAEGLPLDLAYIPLVESAFKPNALSRAKAKGVVAVHDAARRSRTACSRLVHRRAVRSGEGDRRRGEVSRRRSQDVRRRLAPRAGVVQRRPGPRAARDEAVRQSTTSGRWRRSRGYLPRETRDYVPMILAAIVIAKNPAQYGFDVRPPSRRSRTTRSRCRRPVDLRRVAEWTDTTIDEIQALNPELRRWTTPVRDPSYELKVPAGHRRRVSARGWPRPRPTELAALKWYTVKQGETLATIARKLSVSRTDLAEANYLTTTSRVAAGPAADRAARADDADGGAARSAPAPAAESRRAPSPEPRGARRASPTPQRQSRVKRHLPGQARRHARRRSRAVQHDGRLASRRWNRLPSNSHRRRRRD